MKRGHKNHPDFWGREGRGGEEWEAVDREPERGEELGPQGFERPEPRAEAPRSRSKQPRADARERK